jgi:hypothetical protein
VINWLVEHEATTGYRRQYRAYGAMGWPAGQSCRVEGWLAALAVAQRHLGTQGGGEGP